MAIMYMNTTTSNNVEQYTNMEAIDSTVMISCSINVRSGVTRRKLHQTQALPRLLFTCTLFGQAYFIKQTCHFVQLPYYNKYYANLQLHVQPHYTGFEKHLKFHENIQFMSLQQISPLISSRHGVQ